MEPRHFSLEGITPPLHFSKPTSWSRSTIFSAKTFEQVYVTTSGGPVNSSRTLLIHLYETAFKFNHYEEASVIAVFLFVALLVVSAVQWIALRKEVEY